MPTRYAGPQQHTHSTPTNLAGRRPSELTPEIIARAEILSANGAPLATIARSFGLNPDTLHNWYTQGRDGTGNDFHAQFFQAIQRATAEWEVRALSQLRASLDDRTRQWFLTHHPQTRSTYSDAAAERRAVTQAMAAVAKGIEQANLPPDQALALMHHIQAQGIKLPGDEAEG